VVLVSTGRLLQQRLKAIARRGVILISERNIGQVELGFTKFRVGF
jgi:hypothetical protein